MANETLRELGAAVENFKEVVDTLADIKNISENAKSSADAIQQLQMDLTECSAKLVEMVDNVASLCDKLLEENKQVAKQVSDELCDTQKAIVDSNESAIDLITKCNDTVIEKILASNTQIATSVTDYTETVQAHVTEYMLSVQKSIDELRLQSTNNARELRDSISYAKADLAVKADGIQNAVNSLVAKNKSDHILVLIGTTSAVIAAVASIVGLFL